MRKQQLVTGAAIGFLISIPWVAISYTGQQISHLPLMPIDLFEWITRSLPGGVVTAGLEVIIQALQTLQIGALSSTGKSMEFAIAYILAVVALTVLGVIYALTINSLHVYWYVRGFIAGTILGLLAIPLAAWGGWGGATPTTGALWLLAMSLIWGFVLAWSVDTNLRLLAEEGDTGRRRTLIQILVGALALIGGDLISTTLFQGARLKDVLDRAGLMSEAIDIKFSCIDGYTESLPIQSATDPRTLLCYAMGNQPLASEHGAPLRLYTPNRFGMKNPKWIIKIEAISQDYFGYWEQRGWSEQAFVKTASVIDTVKTLSNGNVEAGGVAFAGARGIQKVELQIDDGSWFPVELNRALSPLTWVLWRASFQMPPGQHQLTVRATDGSGELQTPEREGTYPNGATGYHNLSVNIK